MSNRTAQRHPETLCSLLFLVNTDSHNEESNASANGDSDQQEPSPLSGGLKSLPIVLNDQTVDRVLEKISFTTIITETLVTGLVSSSTLYFRENLKQMFEWSNPMYDVRKIGDFYTLCDRSLSTYLQALDDNASAHAILISMAFVKIVSFIGIVCTVGLSIRTKGMTASISKFYQIFKQYMFNIINLMCENPGFFATLKLLAYDRVFENLKWLEENPEAGYAQHLLSLHHRVGINNSLNSVNFGFISELMQYVEVWHIEAIKRGLNRKTNEQIFGVIQRYYPVILTSTASLIPALEPLIGAMSSTAIGAVSAAGTTAGVGELFWAARYGSLAATMEPSGNQGDRFMKQSGNQGDWFQP